MVDIITDDVRNTDMKGVMSKLIPDATAKDIERASEDIYPLKEVYIRESILRKPRFEFSKLLELHEEVGGSGLKVSRPEDPPVQESV